MVQIEADGSTGLKAKVFTKVYAFLSEDSINFSPDL